MLKVTGAVPRASVGGEVTMSSNQELQARRQAVGAAGRELRHRRFLPPRRTTPNFGTLKANAISILPAASVCSIPATATPR